ncbi:hypothetical protein PLCT2_02149 [Planctomycetaceae bacterium]|nr:hypothetical protein PLCT2_02149 [Planctomycetaceae bacterium]
MQTRKHTPMFSALLLAALVMAGTIYTVSCDGGGGGGSIGIGGGVVGQTQAKYDITLQGPTTNGAQVNRPFSLTMNFTQAITAVPVNVLAIESLVVSKVSGPGTLSGTLQLSGNGTDTLTFSNLIIDTQGAYTIQVNGANANAPAISATFNVGPQMDLKFTTIPGSTVYRPRTFSVTVGTVDPSTQAPVTPPTPIDITIARDATTGTGTLGGTTTLTLTGTSTVTFANLTYSANETIRLQASAFGFTTVFSNNITFDSLALANPTVSANPQVNGNFSITAGITSATSGAPVSVNPAITVNVTVATGGGTLSGTTSGSSAGTSVTISGLRYSNAGPATFTLSSTEASSVTTGAVSFVYLFSVTALGPVTAIQGQAIGPFRFEVKDALGALFTGTISQLSWQIVDRTSAAVQQSGTAAFTGGQANVTPAVINTGGGYRLEGTITSPTSTPMTATINIDITSFSLVDDPGPFLALKSVRVGSTYSDNVTFACLSGTTTGTAATFGVLTGSLPAGITLNDSTGALSGTPTTAGAYKFTLYAKQTGGTTAQPLRCNLDVFSTAETEIPAVAPDFRSPGTTPMQNFTILPATAGTPVTNNYLDVEYTCTSTYDNQSRTTTARIWSPDLSTVTTPAPVLVHHRGRGFHFREYNRLGEHLASWGIILISIEDAFSFYAPSSTPATSTYFSSLGTTYDSGYYSAGMQSGGAFQEGTMALMLLLNQAATGTISGTAAVKLSGYTSTATLTSPSSQPFVGKVDPLRVVFSGHSRGGGSTHQSHVRNLVSKCRGVIYFMPFDLRYDTNTVSGAGPFSAGSYNFSINAIPTNMPRLPCLNLAAENDGDLSYPFADQIGDRRVGPTTNVTVWGANHNQTGDAHANDGSPQITAVEQKARLWHLVTAFIKRWTDTDGRYLDGVLYTNQFVNTTTDRSQIGVMGWRNMAERILVDDFQDATTTTNSLGGANSLSAGSRTEASIYPNMGNYASLGIRHNIVTVGTGINATYSTSFTAQDVSKCKRFAMRIGQTTSVGYDWVTVRIRLTDSTNATSTVTVFDRAAPNATYLPDFGTPAANWYDRFVDCQVLLSSFSGISFTSITRVELIYESDSTTTGTRQIYTDDLRFE